jgi:IPT/TIG domain
MLNFPDSPTTDQTFDATPLKQFRWVGDRWRRGLKPPPLLVLTSLVPNATTVGNSVEVRALGSGFTAASEVQFDGAPIATTFVSDIELRFTAPVSATEKTVPVSVVDGAQTSGQLSFIYSAAATQPPVLVAMQPNIPAGVTGPYNLVLDGFYFDGSAVTLFDGVEKGVTQYDGSYRCYCTVNVGVDVISGSTYAVSVRTGMGTSAALTLTVL